MVLGMDRGKCWRWEAVQHLPQIEVAVCLLLQHVFKEATVWQQQEESACLS